MDCDLDSDASDKEELMVNQEVGILKEGLPVNSRDRAAQCAAALSRLQNVQIITPEQSKSMLSQQGVPTLGALQPGVSATLKTLA